MHDLKTPQHSSAWLWWCIHRERMVNHQIEKRFYEINKWIIECNSATLFSTMRWSSGKLMTELYPRPALKLPNVLYFDHEEDLVVYRLRWGIQT